MVAQVLGIGMSLNLLDILLDGLKSGHVSVHRRLVDGRPQGQVANRRRHLIFQAKDLISLRNQFLDGLA